MRMVIVSTSYGFCEKKEIIKIAFGVFLKLLLMSAGINYLHLFSQTKSINDHLKLPWTDWDHPLLRLSIRIDNWQLSAWGLSSPEEFWFASLSNWGVTNVKANIILICKFICTMPPRHRLVIMPYELVLGHGSPKYHLTT